MAHKKKQTERNIMIAIICFVVGLIATYISMANDWSFPAILGVMFMVYGVMEFISTISKSRTKKGPAAFQSMYAPLDDEIHEASMHEVEGYAEAHQNREKPAVQKDDDETLFCPYCGAKAESGYLFCKKCGKRLP